MSRVTQTVVTIFALGVALAAIAPPAAAQEPGVNLLVNPSMEGTYGTWGGIPQMQMPPGWEPWWTEYPHNEGWQNLRPEFSEITTWAGYWNRVHEGAKAMRYFKGWGTFTAGARQTVGGITPGVLLEFTAWGHSWHCEDWNACHEYPESGPPNVWSYPPGASVFMRIGIDPTGGTDPFSGNVVWSNGINALDGYRQFSVQARAQSDRVTVFLWASQNTPAENQDAYWDDARLAVVGPGGGSAPGGGGQQVAQQVTPVTEVLDDGTTVHVVQSGDTLSAIAVAYNMSLEELRALNGLGPNESMIFSGQRLIVRAVAATRVVASPETPEPTPTETPAAVSQVQTPTGGNGWLAYLGWGEDDTDWEIYLLDLGNPGSAPVRLTDNGADDVAPAWSPDGTRLAFASDRDGDYDLYVIDLACLEDGCTEDDATPLTDSDADDSIPAWMPDGEHLVFQSDRDGDGWNLYLLNLADGTVTRLTETAGDEVSAAVQPGSALSLSVGVPGGAAAPSGNRLANGGFEGDAVDFAGDGLLMMPAGWSPWWVDQPSGCEGLRPEFNVSEEAHEGAQAATVFAEAHSFTGGLYQAVSVPRGATVTFSAWGYATAESADSITEMRIGVNPGGGFNPLADNVVWSEPVDASEGFVQFEVTAVAQSDRVTVFTWTHPGACAANSAYWDGAELTVEP